jgi:hypothetical protein
MKGILRFFDKLEDKVRGVLSHYPMFYAMIGGFAIVIFWRGVWETADMFKLSAPWSIVGSSAIMMVTGLFVSFFIGDRVILSGLKNEKKLAEKTEEELKVEEVMIRHMNMRLDRIEKQLSDLSEKIK